MGAQGGLAVTEYECLLIIGHNSVDVCLHSRAPLRQVVRAGKEIPGSPSEWVFIHAALPLCTAAFNHHFHFSNSFHLLLQAADLATIV